MTAQQIAMNIVLLNWDVHANVIDIAAVRRIRWLRRWTVPMEAA